LIPERIDHVEVPIGTNIKYLALKGVTVNWLATMLNFSYFDSPLPSTLCLMAMS
jgi:predicted ATPase